MPTSTRLILVTLCFTFFLAGCYEKQEEKVARKAAPSALLPYEITTYPAVIEPVTQSIRLNGKIEYNPNQVVHYTSLINGIVTKTYFSLGDKVAKGQVLAELQSSELTDLTSQSKTLESQLVVARRKLVVAESMFGDRIASEKELFEAKSEVDILKNEIEKVSANLSLYNASSEKGVFQIKAPVSGYVVENKMSAGTRVQTDNADLFTISDLSDVWITTNVYAVDLPFVEKGMKAEIRSKAYPGETFNGEISDISQVFDSQERVLKARIQMPNKDLKLKPGLAIEAIIKKNMKDLAIGVPDRALIFHNNENYLLIQRPDNTLEPRKVNVDVKDNDRVFFRNGIAAGEKIVIKNQLLLFSETLNSGK